MTRYAFGNKGGGGSHKKPQNGPLFKHQTTVPITDAHLTYLKKQSYVSLADATRSCIARCMAFDGYTPPVLPEPYSNPNYREDNGG